MAVVGDIGLDLTPEGRAAMERLNELADVTIEVGYSERRDVPATIFLSISAPFSDMVMSILGTHDLIVRPAGVKVRVDCSTEDAETFGFVDLNKPFMKSS